MTKKRIISFDLDGTLADLNFEKAVWLTEIPRLFAKKNNLDFETAKSAVFAAYAYVGDKDARWYDIKFWFRELGLAEDYNTILKESSHLINLYPDTIPALRKLSKSYELIVISNATREFINFKLRVENLEKYFTRVFSATSDFGCIKGEPRGYLEACNRMGIPPTELTHIGDDYQFDYVSARKVGIDAYFLERKKTEFPVEKGRKVRDLGEFAEIILAH
ncbi:MAG: HAD family hydrolase [Candidatus Micrarchaeota archaeon]